MNCPYLKFNRSHHDESDLYSATPEIDIPISQTQTQRIWNLQKHI
jgi:hypothetical protein